MPRRSATPGRRLWLTTSAHRTSRWATSWPAGFLRSTAIERLPRWAPLNGLVVGRNVSPSRGSSLITSAPRSASRRLAYGPAKYIPKSRTLMPSRVVSMGCVLPSGDHPVGRPSGSELRSCDHPIAPQLGDRLIVVAELVEDLVGVLT